jgi:SAM-dependent methyltransferase
MDITVYRQMREAEDHHWWFVGRRLIIETLIKSLELTGDARILDMGTGTGGNLEMLSRFGSVTGVEPDESASELASARGVATVLNGSLPDGLPVFSNGFDLIVMLDVLEHIEYDEQAVTALAKLLNQGGRMVITVPAFPFLWSHHDVIHHHKRRYKLATLKEVLQNSGMRVCHMTYFNMWLFPLISLVRLLSGLLPGCGRNGDISFPSPRLNRLLTCIFASERKLAGRTRIPFGVSILALVEKHD